MEDVNNPNQVVNEPGNPGTPAPSTDGGNVPGGDGGQEPAAPQGDPGQQPQAPNVSPEEQIKNLNQALKIEREKNRRLARQGGDGNLENVGDDLLSNPEFVKIALENAVYQLKEGVKEIIDRYPQLPKAVAKAISRNPRGWVNDGTGDVPNALLDIEDNIIAYLEEEGLQQPQPDLKPVRVAGNNNLNNTPNNVDVEISRIMAIPPEDWTKEDEAIVAAYNKKKK